MALFGISEERAREIMVEAAQHVLQQEIKIKVDSTIIDGINTRLNKLEESAAKHAEIEERLAELAEEDARLDGRADVHRDMLRVYEDRINKLEESDVRQAKLEKRLAAIEDKVLRPRTSGEIDFNPSLLMRIENLERSFVCKKPAPKKRGRPRKAVTK